MPDYGGMVVVPVVAIGAFIVYAVVFWLVACLFRRGRKRP